MSAEIRPQLLHALIKMARQCDSKSRVAELLVMAHKEIEDLAAENVKLKARVLMLERRKS